MLDLSDESGFEEAVDSPLLLSGTANLYAAAANLPLPRSLPLVEQEYSLEPDMLFGWKPKAPSSNGPIPLNFGLRELPAAVNFATELPYPVIYNGFRPTDSINMHRELSLCSDYRFPLSAQVMSTYQSLW